MGDRHAQQRIDQENAGYIDQELPAYAEIKGYAARIGNIAKASRILKAGTPIGIGLNGLSAYLEIEEACSTGREDMCRKAKYVEEAKLVGSFAGGIGGWSIVMAFLMPVCLVVFGVATGGLGVLGCGIAAGAIGGYAGGEAGGALVGTLGELIYEWNP